MVRQAAAAELFAGRKPIRMGVEQESLCWVSGRWAERRDGATGAEAFGHLPARVQLTREDGTGLEKGLAQILGVADQLGSVEAGKRANLVLTNGDLL